MSRLFEYAQNLRGVIFLLLLVLCSCGSREEKSDCEKLEQGAVVPLKGTAEIDSKGMGVDSTSVTSETRITLTVM